MNCYTHLTIEEREKILELRSQGKGIREMSRQLGRNASTISREVKRNKQAGNAYSPHKAQKQYEARRMCCKRRRILTENTSLRKMIRWLMVHLWWSPEQVANRLRLETSEAIVSTSTIYRALSNGCLDDSIRRQLRRHKRTNGVKAPGKGGSNRKYHRSIHDRPQTANDRSEFGHLEGDTVTLKKGGILLTLVDRCSRMLYTTRLPGYDSTALKQAVKTILLSLPPEHRKTLTLDRGTEFARLPELEKEVGITCYFCDPASPKQRATSENTNGLLRQFFPKKSLTFNPALQLDSFTALLNLRPRKCLAWLSPWEAHSGYLLHFT